MSKETKIQKQIDDFDAKLKALVSERETLAREVGGLEQEKRLLLYQTQIENKSDGELTSIKEHISEKNERLSEISEICPQLETKISELQEDLRSAKEDTLYKKYLAEHEAYRKVEVEVHEKLVELQLSFEKLIDLADKVTELGQGVGERAKGPVLPSDLRRNLPMNFAAFYKGRFSPKGNGFAWDVDLIGKLLKKRPTRNPAPMGQSGPVFKGTKAA